MVDREVLPTHLEYGDKLSQERKIRQQQAGDAGHASTRNRNRNRNRSTINYVTYFPETTYESSNIDRWNRTRNNQRQTGSLAKN